jgi:hypothetical protein
MFSSASATLREIAEAVAAAAEAADPAAATITPSWGTNDTKAMIDDKHAGRILELKDSTFRLVGHPRASRMRGGSPDMIVSAGQQTAKTELKGTDWMDSDIKRFSPPVVGAEGLCLGLVAASASMHPEAPGADYAQITITADGIPAFNKPIVEGIDLLSHANGDKLVWTDWIPQAAAPHAAPAPPAAAIAADRLGAANTPLRLLLAALGVSQIGNEFDATLLSSWLAVMARIPDRAPSIRLALIGPAIAADALLAQVAASIASLAAANQDAIAAAAEDALDAWRQLPAGVPSQQEAVVADAFCRTLVDRLPQRAAPHGSPELDASDSEPEDALAAPPPFQAHGSPTTLAYIARLEAQQRQSVPTARALHPSLVGAGSPAGGAAHTPPPHRPLGPGSHGTLALTPPAGRLSSHAAASALRGGVFSPAPAAAPAADPRLTPAMAELAAVIFPPAARGMAIEAALTRAAHPQPDATELRRAIAAANNNRPLLDGILGAGSASSARSFLSDILEIEVTLGYSWTRPQPSSDWSDALDFAAALVLARHRAVSPSPAAPAGLSLAAAAAAGTPPAYTPLTASTSTSESLTYPPGLRAAYPPEAVAKVFGGSDAKLGLAYGVLAPLTSSSLIRSEHRHAVDIMNGSTAPASSAEVEALRLCATLGQPAVAYHISSGRCTREIAGESVPRPLHDSREATHDSTLQRTRSHIGDGCIDRVSAAVAALSASVSTLRGFCYEAIVVLLGGEDAERTRGVRPARLGSDTDGDWGNVANRAHVVKAFSAFGSLLADSVCLFANIPAGPARDCGFSALAGDAFRQLGFYGAAKFMRLVLTDLEREATTLCINPNAPPLDILGLLSAWRVGTLPTMRNEGLLSEFLDERLGAAADSQAARAKAQLVATAAAASAAAELLPASALIGAASGMLKECERIQNTAAALAKATPANKAPAPAPALGAALASIPPSGVTPAAGGKRAADPNSKNLLRKAGKAAAAVAQAATTAPPGRQPPALMPPIAPAPQQSPQQLSTAFLQQLPPPLPQQPQPQPAPRAPPAAALLTAAPPAAGQPTGAPTGPLSLAAIQAAIAPLGPLKHRGDCCKAVDAVYRAAFPTGAQWQCPGIFLFGACLSSTLPNSAPCRRCAKAASSPAPTPPPAGTKTAIRSACTDAAIVAAVTPGG